jgi:hypothetical protein
MSAPQRAADRAASSPRLRTRPPTPGAHPSGTVAPGRSSYTRGPDPARHHRAGPPGRSAPGRSTPARPSREEVAL